MAATFDVRCSVLLVHRHTVLLVQRTHDGLDDWVLPGGTPREGESLVDVVFLATEPVIGSSLLRAADPA